MKRTVRSPLRDVLARNLRRLRAERGWSQERLAHEAGLNRTYLSAVERSEQNMSLDNLHKLSLALATPAGVLLTDEAAGGASQTISEGPTQPRRRTPAKASGGAVDAEAMDGPGTSISSSPPRSEREAGAAEAAAQGLPSDARAQRTQRITRPLKGEGSTG